ncbi:MAG: polysaccharide deacetylase family protein [Bacteroidota bacterium]
MPSRTHLKFWLKGQIDAACFYRKKYNAPPSNPKRILVYHGLDLENNTRLNTKFISKTKFEKEMAYLKKYCRVLPLKDLLQTPAQSDKLQVALTFDDGYANNYDLARPILEKYQLPATFFISIPQLKGYDILWADLLDLTRRKGSEQMQIRSEIYIKRKAGYIRPDGQNLKTSCTQKDGTFIEEVIQVLLPYAAFKNKEASTLYWKLMSPAQILKLAYHPLFSIGAHGMLHSSIHQLSSKEAQDELSNPKAYLENIIQKEVSFFAYPHGLANQASISRVRASNYAHQFLGNEGMSELSQSGDVHNRLGINPFISASSQMYYFYKGGY